MAGQLDLLDDPHQLSRLFLGEPSRHRQELGDAHGTRGFFLVGHVAAVAACDQDTPWRMI
jgi:hypothetical protein